MILCGSSLCMPASARVKQTSIYMFGFATSFSDSLAVITPVQRVDTVYVNMQNGFLRDRNLYSAQLQEYVEANGIMHNPLTSVFTASSKSTLEKKALSLRKKYAKDNSLLLQEIPCRFHSEIWIDPEAMHIDESQSNATK